MFSKIIFFLLTILYGSITYAAIIILDPGHGGDDLGAKTSYWYAAKKERELKVYFEKNIVLEIAKVIQEKLEKKGHQVFLTRTIDRKLELQDRAKMADKVNADIFISIHANASTSKKSQGIETFYLDNHTDKAVKKIEKIENIASTGEEAIVDKILIDLAVTKTAPLSKKLAQHIHSELSKNTIKKFRLKDRGIKPGLFYVLALSQRPAVLLEVGFLTNKKEGKLLMDDSFQSRYADDVVKGIDEFIGKKKDLTVPLF